MKKRLLSLLFLPIMVLGISVVNANDVSCESGFEYDEDNNICYKLDNTYNVPIYYGIDMDSTHSYNGKPIGTITVKLPDGNTLTMMDMNLGATISGTVCTTTDTGACGAHFQWGNNAPLSSSSEVSTGTNPELFTGTRAIYENYWPGHPYSSELFIFGNNEYWMTAKIGDSFQKSFSNIWGGLGDEPITTSIDTFLGGINNGDTRQGPCPTGYHVPSHGEWNALVAYWCNIKFNARKSYTGLTMCNDDWNINTNVNTKFRMVFKLPIVGNRGFKDTLIDHSENGYYWSSSPRSDAPHNAYALQLLGNAMVPDMYLAHGRSMSVRCFKDSHLASSVHTLTFDENGGNLLGATGDEGEGTLIQNVASGRMAQQPVNPTKVNATFLRWIEEGDEEAAFDFSSPITSSKTLKAIYKCDEGYVEVEGECVYPKITISVNNSDFGSVDSGLVVVRSGTAISVDENILTIGDIDVTATPSESGAQYSYTFVDWSNECGEILTGDCTITGNFSQTINEYEITWKDGDSILKTDNVEYGNVPNYGENPTKSGNVFDAWDPNPSEVTGNAIYTATWKPDINNNGLVDEDEPHYILTIHYMNGKGGQVYPDYTGSYISGEFYDIASEEKEYYTVDKMAITGTMGNMDIEERVVYKANNDKNNNGIADEDEPKSGGSSGGGSRSSRTSDKDKDTTNNPSVTDVTAPLESGVQGDSNDGSPLSRGDTASAERGSTQNYTPEFISAYEFAHEKGITTMSTINDADMEGKLTRIAMAKMLSYYAINVLGQKPDETRINKFKDITDEMDAEYNNAVTLAYQLGIMGINMPDNKFRPDDEVIRAEFGTALSRMLFGIADGEGERYYSTHLAKLMEEHIITVDTPYLQELRGYVMIMLMRSAK